MKIEKATDTLYQRYPTQCQAQKAYMELNPAEETVEADWDREIGGGVPGAVWHGTLLRWTIPNDLTVDSINSLMEGLQPLLQRVCNGYSCEHDGSNWKGALDEDAQEASAEIERAIEEASGELDRLHVLDPSNYFATVEDEIKIKLKAGTAPEDIEELSVEDDILFDPDLDAYLNDLGVE